MKKQCVAIYARVSSKRQDLRSQLPDLQRWAEAQSLPVNWFTDKSTGTKMNRSGWSKLEELVRGGSASTVVCWRIDRLGRTAKGLVTLFDELRRLKVNLVSIRDGLDLSTAAGRLTATILAGVAQFESEVRGERVLAGQAVARANGKKWGGSTKGIRKKVTPLQIKAIKRMKKDGETIRDISKAVKLSRPTIYSVLSA